MAQDRAQARGEAESSLIDPEMLKSVLRETVAAQLGGVAETISDLGKRVDVLTEDVRDGVAPYDKVVAANVAAARGMRRLSQKTVAERMMMIGYKWHQQTVAAVEGGKRDLAVGELLGLAYALETSTAALLTPDTGQSLIELPKRTLKVSAASVISSLKGIYDGCFEWRENGFRLRRAPDAHQPSASLGDWASAMEGRVQELERRLAELERN